MGTVLDDLVTVIQSVTVLGAEKWLDWKGVKLNLLWLNMALNMQPYIK